jgi:hypothetical protein
MPVGLQDNMIDIIRQIRDADRAGLYYMALFGTLAFPTFALRLSRLIIAQAAPSTKRTRILGTVYKTPAYFLCQPNPKCINVDPPASNRKNGVEEINPIHSSAVGG